MTRRSLYTAILIISLTASVEAKLPLRFSIGSVMEWGFGTTEYNLDAFEANEGTVTYVRSRLEFPLDAAMAGIRFEVRSLRDGRQDWAAMIRILRNLNNPGQQMLDHDWLNDVKTSYTESDAELSATVFDVEVSRVVAYSDAIDLALMAGFSYHYIYQDIVGYDGWWLADDNSTRLPISRSGLAMTYKVKYAMPQIGLAPAIQFSKNLRVDAKAAFTRLFVSDVDDHVLRNKLSKADGPGIGYLTRLCLHYAFRGSENHGISIDLTARFTSLRAEISQTQSWYGNDPADDYRDPITGEIVIIDNTGAVAVGIDHEIRSKQYSLGFRINYTFR